MLWDQKASRGRKCIKITVFFIEDRLGLHALFGLDFKDTLLLLRRVGKLQRLSAVCCRLLGLFPKLNIKINSSFIH